MIKVCGLVGSLRRDSYNKGLMRAAQEAAKEAGIEITVFDRLSELPAFNEDLEKDLPEPVVALRQAILDADALYIVTPEYNYSTPGLLKNAIDWASRPPAPSPLKNKPAALAGASMGIGATIRAQLSLRQIFIQTETHALLKPEILIAHAQKVFDKDINLTDEFTKSLLVKQMAAFKEWIARF